MKKNRSLAHLGGMTAETFLRTHWQKKPLLIRDAFANFVAPLTRAEVLELAARDEAETRLITRRSHGWQMRHGPFNNKALRIAAVGAAWTMLIQDTQHFSHEAHLLLQQFDFIPHARVDDLMVSIANQGGGVGPHVDSYDVFLLQGEGERRWQISAQRDVSLQPDVPLKILAKFEPEQEWVLKTGDMLYLPPGYAHHGVAEGDCLTWSIGFRAPSRQELSAAFLDYLRDELVFEGNYVDPDLATTAHAGAIDAEMETRFSNMLNPLLKAASDTALRRQFLGRFLTEPKSHVTFEAPEDLSEKQFTRAIARNGIRLDLRSRFLSLSGEFFMNGSEISAPRADRKHWQHLADTRALPATSVAALSLASRTLLYSLYHDGYVTQ